MNKLSKIILFLILVSLFMPLAPAKAAGNAVMKLTSVKTDYNLGDNVYIDIMIEPNGEDLNVARAIMDFTGADVLLINDFNINTSANFNLSPSKELNNTTDHINVGGFILVDAMPQNPPATKLGTLIFKANQVGSSSINFASGSHLISLSQEEKINLSACEGITINVLDALPVPNRAPVFTHIADKNIELGQSVSFHVQATDADGDNVTLTTDIPADAVFANITSGPIAGGDLTWTPTDRGSFALKFFGTDDNPDGSKTGSLTVNVNVSVPIPPANQAPIFQSVANKSIKLGESVNLHVQATDPDGDKVNLTWNIPAGASFSNITNNAVTVSGDFSWTPASEGVYTATFTGEDDDATDPKSKTLSVSIGVSVPPNHAPIFEPIAEKSVNAGETLTFNVSATDPDGDNVTLSSEPLETAALTSITSGVTSTSRFSWAPENFGVYYAVFKAEDDNPNSLESTQTVRITVFGGKCPPCSRGGGGGGYCPICECKEQIFGEPITKDLPAIMSPTHPSQDIWYSNNKPQFNWEISSQNLGYVFNIDPNPLADPSFGYYFSQDKMFSFSELADGFWYFHLKVKYDDGFSQTAHYQVKIDTTAPEFFKPNFEGDKLYFSALDKHSGVAYFEMKIDDGLSGPKPGLSGLKPGQWQKVQSPLILNEQEKQGKIMVLRVVDNAGNAIESRIDLLKKELIKEEQKKYSIDQPESVLSAPIIDLVNYPVVRGRALPGAKIYLIVSTEPQAVFYALTDYQGNWLAYIDKKLKSGKYDLYAIANYNNIDSAPSDKVFFSVSSGIKTVKKFCWWCWLIIIVVCLICLKKCWNLLKKYYQDKNQKKNREIKEIKNEIKEKEQKIKEKTAGKIKNRR